MTPQDTQNFLPAFLLIGAPIITVFGGPFGWRALVLLGALAGLVYAPLTACAVIGLWLLWVPLWWFLEALVGGFAAGLGARLAGTFNSPERAERLRERWEREHR